MLKFAFYYYIKFYAWWDSVSSIGKVSDSWIRDLRFNPRLVSVCVYIYIEREYSIKPRIELWTNELITFSNIPLLLKLINKQKNIPLLLIGLFVCWEDCMCVKRGTRKKLSEFHSCYHNPWDRIAKHVQ